MSELIFNSLYVFFIVIEMILFIYIFSSWIPGSGKFKELLATLISPILDPIRYLMKHSIFRTRNIDVSPFIAFIIISYLQTFFYSLI